MYILWKEDLYCKHALLFSAGYSNQQNEVIKGGSSKDAQQVIHKVHRKIPWKQARASKLCPHSTMCNRIDMLDCSRQMWKIYWVLTCKLEDNKVFHIHVKLFDKNTDMFIEKSPNPSEWEISNLEKQRTIRQLGGCYNDIRYCYDHMANLHWLNANKIKFKNWRGEKPSLKNTVNCF